MLDPNTLAPSSMGTATAPVPAPPTPAPVVPPAPAIRFIGDRLRQTTIALDWPLALGDVEYRAVLVRRLSTAEIGAFVDRLRGVAEGETLRFPLFFDERGAPLPDAVWDALDPDDVDALNKAASDFLPARFRAQTAPSSPPTGDITGSSSPTSPASA